MAKKTKILPKVSFTGYPDGKAVDFKAGVESEPVPVAWIKEAQLVEKDLIKNPKSSAPDEAE